MIRLLVAKIENYIDHEAYYLLGNDARQNVLACIDDVNRTLDEDTCKSDDIRYMQSKLSDIKEYIEDANEDEDDGTLYMITDALEYAINLTGEMMYLMKEDE